MSGKKSVTTLAANRGTPPNPSRQVRETFEAIAAHEAKYGPGEIGGYTCALWGEIREYELAEPLEGGQWKLAFGLARVLEERFGPDRVRFVVWFNW